MTTCSRVSDSSSIGPWPGRSATSRRWGHRLGGRWLRRWPSTGSWLVSWNVLWRLGRRRGRRREVLAVADALGHYERALDLWERVADPESVAGVERPDLLERAAEVASGGGEHELSHPLRRCRDRRVGAHRRGAGQIGLLCEQKTWYLGSGRPRRTSCWSGPSAPCRARAARTADPGTRRACSAAHANALVHRRSATRRRPWSRQAALEAARRVRGPRSRRPAPTHALGICLLMTSTDPEAGIREFEQALGDRPRDRRCRERR